METKYRDIADGNSTVERVIVLSAEVGNQVPRYSGWKRDRFYHLLACELLLETKYRDIADGNILSVAAAILHHVLVTKYRDIADGNIT